MKIQNHISLNLFLSDNHTLLLFSFLFSIRVAKSKISDHPIFDYTRWPFSTLFAGLRVAKFIKKIEK